MKTALLFILLGGGAIWTQEKGPVQSTYYVAVVMKGPKWTAERTPELTRVSLEHRDWLRKLASEGKVLLYGPFTDNSEVRGLYVFKVSSAQEAKTLCDGAPAVKFGQVRAEIHPWQATQAIDLKP